MPSVAISRTMPSWLTRWRRTSRSTSQASATITAAASMKASGSATGASAGSHRGSHSARRASARAPNSTIAPWAKLKTPEALKISTKPSAISEYSTPAINPPSTTSMKKSHVLSVRRCGAQWFTPR